MLPGCHSGAEAVLSQCLSSLFSEFLDCISIGITVLSLLVEGSEGG